MCNPEVMNLNPQTTSAQAPKCKESANFSIISFFLDNLDMLYWSGRVITYWSNDMDNFTNEENNARAIGDTLSDQE